MSSQKRGRKTAAQKRRESRTSYKPININTIRRWQYQYSEGKMSKRQQKEIMARLEAERKIANRRMKRFSDAGQTTAAYTRALGRIQQNLGKGRKTWGKARSFEDLLMNAGVINAFVSSEQSTLSGAEAYRKKKRAEFRNDPRWKRISEKMSDQEIDEFLNMLHDDTLGDYFDSFADYTEQVEQLAVIMSEESGTKWLQGKLKAYRDFMEETQRLGSSFHSRGISPAELRERINARYQRIEHRRRR